jgi:tetratricopeptide (TPR) repeat protein
MQAYNRYQKALEIHKRNGDHHAIAKVLDNMGNVLSQLEQNEAAVLCHEQALKLAEDLKDVQMIGNASGNLAITLSRLGKYERALELHQRAIASFEKLGDIAEQVAEYGHAAQILGRLGKYSLCEQYFAHMLHLSENSLKLLLEREIVHHGRKNPTKGNPP